MNAQADLFRKPTPRARKGTRAPGLRAAVWALFADGMQLSANAVAAILGADLSLVQRRISDLAREGLIYNTRRGERSHGTKRAASIWSKTGMGTVSIEAIEKNGWITTKDDRAAVAALEVYVDRMKAYGKEPCPRLRLEQYDRFWRLARMIDKACDGMTFNGFRVLGGGSSA